MRFPPDRHGDNRWNLCLDALIEAWNQAGPDVTLSTLGWLTKDRQVACDADCEIGPVHCWNRHRPNHKPDWHDPERCDAATTGEVA